MKFFSVNEKVTVLLTFQKKDAFSNVVGTITAFIFQDVQISKKRTLYFSILSLSCVDNCLSKNTTYPFWGNGKIQGQGITSVLHK